MRTRAPLLRRFLAKIRWTEAFCPWIWKGNCDSCGYAKIVVRDAETDALLSRKASRVAYELFNGPIPDGMQVLHNCDNPKCIWPGHLRLGTQSENIKEAFDKGRKTQLGEENSCHKLTEREVKEIKSSGLSVAELASKYEVAKTTIYMILQGNRWGHVV